MAVVDGGWSMMSFGGWIVEDGTVVGWYLKPCGLWSGSLATAEAKPERYINSCE